VGDTFPGREDGVSRVLDALENVYLKQGIDIVETLGLISFLPKHATVKRLVGIKQNTYILLV
jgi:hypothetical protein